MNDELRIMKTKKQKSAQDMQDEIFRKMSMEKKIELWANFWLLGKELEKNKQAYGNNRPAVSATRRS